MIHPKDKSALKSLLAKGKITEVIEHLKQDVDADLKTINALVLISRELEEQKQEERLNTKTQDQISAQKNKLTHNLLAIIDETPLADVLPGQDTYSHKGDNFKLFMGNRTITIMLIGIILLAILYLVFMFLVLQNAPDDSTIILG